MKKSVFIAIILGFVLGIFCIHYYREKKELNSFYAALNGKGTFSISKIEISGYKNAAPRSVVIVDRESLDYLSRKLRQAKEDSKFGITFQAEMVSDSGTAIETRILISDRLEFITIPVFPSAFEDPTYLTFPLDSSMPQNLHDSLETLFK